MQELAIFSRHLSSDIAVKSLFVVTGFLIFMSYENSGSVSGYFGKRIRRIYPAYAFVILASALLGGIFFPSLANFGRYGDFSYGIYIVHSPILQLLIAYGSFERAPWLALLTAMGLVMVAAMLLWHFIEKPFLRRSSHYVATNRG